MLAVIFRGFVFLGVISWYSTSLWKAIDGIFKDQFQRYLEDEYRRNPRMREHVVEYSSGVGKPGNQFADDAVVVAQPEAVQRLLESCGGSSLSDVCSVDEAVAAIEGEMRQRERDESVPADCFEVKEATAAPGAAVEDAGVEKEKEVDRPVLDAAGELAFRDSRWIDGDAEPPDEREQPAAIE